QQERLAAVAVDPAELRDAFRQVIDSLLQSPNGDLVVAPVLVARFGPAARLLFSPETEANLRPA
ncbi:MAG: hypothetical protein M3Z98_10395, partial [Candidatus Dormibacteraeota bacterium]|nr:hypothetical protein [Candidatus Dormibacteraeota bacterium]